MSSNAHSGTHDIAFYEADIGGTFVISASTTLANAPSDVEGALPPGRYLVQAISFSDATATCWLHVGRFESGTPLVPGNDIAAGTQRFPLHGDAMPAIEFNVLTGHNDRVAVVTSAGTATVYLSRVSTITRKGN